MKRDKALERALDALPRKLEPGGAARLASELGITYQAVNKWRRVPVEHVLKVEELTGVSRYDLRPDVYGEAP